MKYNITDKVKEPSYIQWANDFVSKVMNKAKVTEYTIRTWNFEQEK